MKSEQCNNIKALFATACLLLQYLKPCNLDSEATSFITLFYISTGLWVEHLQPNTTKCLQFLFFISLFLGVPSPVHLFPQRSQTILLIILAYIRPWR